MKSTYREEEPGSYLKGQGHIFNLSVDILHLTIRFYVVILLLQFAKVWKALENDGPSWKVLENRICLEKFLKTGKSLE